MSLYRRVLLLETHHLWIAANESICKFITLDFTIIQVYKEEPYQLTKTEYIQNKQVKLYLKLNHQSS